MKVKYLNNKGKNIEKGFEVPYSLFGGKVNKSLLSQYVFSYLSNKREANAQTRDRGEVSGGGRKPWNQKGTGRARAGSIRSPIWRGGGVTFGPSNDRNYKKSMTKKMIKRAFTSAFSLINKQEKFFVIEKLGLKEMSTKSIADIFNKLLKEGKLLLVQNGSNKELIKSCANIKNIQLVNVTELNVYDLLNAKSVCVIDDAMEYVLTKWAGKALIEKKKIIKKSVIKKTATKKTKSKAKKAMIIKKTKKK